MENCELEDAAFKIRELMPLVLEVTDLDALRGLEGVGATAYFGVFDHLLLNRKEDFFFHGRNRRPPHEKKIEHFGCQNTYRPEDPLIL